MSKIYRISADLDSTMTFAIDDVAVDVYGRFCHWCWSASFYVVCP